MFDGAADKMLLAFVREKKITKDDLLRLAELVEREGKG